MYSDDDLLMLSGIQHFAFCKRQWALIHLEMQWAENDRTTRGKYVHKKVDNYRTRESKNEMVILRSARISSYRLGLSGICDIIEIISKNGCIMSAHPVEYKSGRPKEGCYDKVQLCAQAMAIEEMMGVDVRFGSIYYNEIRRRLIVPIDEELRGKTSELSKEMHDDYEKGITPGPRHGEWCRNCSLNDICMPSVIFGKASSEEYIKKHI